MPLSFYPGKSDGELLIGFDSMDVERVSLLWTDAQYTEYEAWRNSPEVQRIKREHTHYKIWMSGFAVWMIVNFLAVVLVLLHRAAPYDALPANTYMARWMLVAFLVAFLAPVKVRMWQFRTLYVALVVVSALGTGVF